jgi:integrase
MPTYTQRKDHLLLWQAAIGATRRRDTITSGDIRMVLNRWKVEGFAAATCNKRRAALSHLFSTLDGKDARNPVRGVPKFPEPPALPRGQDFELVKQALALLPGKTRWRCEILAWTGLRPVELCRVRPDDVDLNGAKLLTRTAKLGPARVLPLAPEAVEAFRRLDELDGWGRFTCAPIDRYLKKVCAAVGLPPMSLYDLRHTVGTELFRRGEDLAVIQEWLGHSSPSLTRRYTLAAVPGRLQRALQRLGATTGATRSQNTKKKAS